MCLCVPITLCLVHSPKGLIMLCAGYNTKAASLYLSPSSSPREHSRHSKSICLSASASIRTWSNQISFSLRSILLCSLAEHYSNAGPATKISSLLFQRGLLCEDRLCIIHHKNNVRGQVVIILLCASNNNLNNDMVTTSLKVFSLPYYSPFTETYIQ